LRFFDSKSYKVVELFLLGVILPGSVIIFKLANYIILILWIIFIYSLIIFLIFYKNKYKEVLKLNSVTKKNLLVIITRWIFISIVLYIITYYFFNDKLFIVQKNNPDLIWKILVMYPIFSALPQEFLFCTFFFSRYQNFFKNQEQIIYASALFFSLAHVFFLNMVAPILGFLAGLIFARTFYNTRSLFLVSIEHGLYGNSLFYIGLGWYFWGGSII